MRVILRLLGFACCLGAALVAPAPVAGDEFVTGADLRRALNEPIGPITWAEKPLRGALERLVESQHVAIMLDRRIDPEQKVDFSGSGVSLEGFVAALAEKYGASMCQVGPVLYVGPGATTQLLPTVVAKQQGKVLGLGVAPKKRLLRASAWSWPRLTTPRELVDQLEREYSVEIIGKEKVPHDLWPAVQLPPLGFVEKLSLVLAGFHVTFELAPEGDAVRLVAMPPDASLERRYTPHADAASLAAQLAAKFPQAKIRAAGKELVVDGRWEVHDALQRMLAGERVRPTPQPAEGKKTYTLNVENKPVGGVMKALAAQLGKSVTFDDVKVERRLAKEITLSVKDASLAELLRSVLEPAALQYELQGDTIRVYD